MPRTPIAFAAALACSAGAANAELIEFTVSGVVTDVLASYGPGAFSDLSVGDTWTYTMVYDVRDGFVPPAYGTFFDVPQWSDPVSFVSASFSAGDSTLVVTEQDLHTWNDWNWTSSISYGPDGEPTGIDFERGPRGLFDMNVSTAQPSVPVWDDGVVTLDFSPWAQVGANYVQLSQLETLLPSGIFGSTADGDRWATFDLEGGRFAGLITDYSYGPWSGRVVPAPGAAALLLTAGLATTRRRR
jgi:hypothetical protein